MTTITPLEEGDRTTSLETVLEELILKIMINLNQRGYGTREILDALETVCIRQQVAYSNSQDSDPADDPE